MEIDNLLIQDLIKKILSKEKEFVNEKRLSEKEKQREIKKLIEETVKLDDN